MSKITDILADVRKNLNEDQKEKLGKLLAGAESEYNELKDNFDVVKDESVKRKETIRELKAKELKNDELIGDLTKKSDTTALQNELNSLKAFKKDYLRKQKETFVKDFDTVSKHPKFAKVQSRFILPKEKDDNDAFDFSKLKDEDLEKNLNVLNDLNSLEYFESSDKQHDEKPLVDGNKFGNNKEQKPLIKTKADLVRHTQNVIKKTILQK